MPEWFISEQPFKAFLDILLQDRALIAPVVEFGEKHLAVINRENLGQVDLAGFRTVEPLKSWFFKISQQVASNFASPNEQDSRATILLGARGCDLEALEVMDRVFTEGELSDGFYQKNRERALIIGVDCTSFGQTCFCTLMKGQPYPVKLFDLNLSPIGGGFLVETGSERGLKLINDNQSFFSEATDQQRAEKAKIRDAITHQLVELNARFGIKRDIAESHKINLENKAWRELTKDCVECSACNFICPTCSCFLLTDEAKAGEFERNKVWDACLKSGYSRLAGGANPRGKLHQRLQNRYHCKCDYSYDRLGRYTCVGCGRCIDGCAGNIDMRKIFAELERLAPLAAKLV